MHPSAHLNHLHWYLKSSEEIWHISSYPSSSSSTCAFELHLHSHSALGLCLGGVTNLATRGNQSTATTTLTLAALRLIGRCYVTSRSRRGMRGASEGGARVSCPYYSVGAQLHCCSSPRAFPSTHSHSPPAHSSLFTPARRAQLRASWRPRLPPLPPSDCRSSGTSSGGTWFGSQLLRPRTRTRDREHCKLGRAWRGWQVILYTHAGRTREQGRPVSGLSRTVCRSSAFSGPETTKTAR